MQLKLPISIMCNNKINIYDLIVKLIYNTHPHLHFPLLYTFLIVGHFSFGSPSNEAHFDLASNAGNVLLVYKLKYLNSVFIFLLVKYPFWCESNVPNSN